MALILCIFFSQNVLICVNVPATMRALGLATPAEKKQEKQKGQTSGAASKVGSAATAQTNSDGQQLSRAQKKKKRQKAKKAAAKAAATVGDAAVTPSVETSFQEAESDDNLPNRGEARPEEDQITDDNSSTKSLRFQPSTYVELLAKAITIQSL
jgi:Ni,Fe-hydrogenase I large subunit